MMSEGADRKSNNKLRWLLIGIAGMLAVVGLLFLFGRTGVFVRIRVICEIAGRLVISIFQMMNDNDFEECRLSSLPSTRDTQTVLLSKRS